MPKESVASPGLSFDVVLGCGVLSAPRVRPKKPGWLALTKTTQAWACIALLLTSPHFTSDPISHSALQGICAALRPFLPARRAVMDAGRRGTLLPKTAIWISLWLGRFRATARAGTSNKKAAGRHPLGWAPAARRPPHPSILFVGISRSPLPRLSPTSSPSLPRLLEHLGPPRGTQRLLAWHDRSAYVADSPR